MHGWALNAVETLGKDACGRCLSYTTRTGKEKRVADTPSLYRSFERHHNMSLAGQLIEILWTVFQ
jgi:hypothetical protein